MKDIDHLSKEILHDMLVLYCERIVVRALSIPKDTSEFVAANEIVKQDLHDAVDALYSIIGEIAK